MELKGVMLSEISETEKENTHDLTYMRIRRNKMKTDLLIHRTKVLVTRKELSLRVGKIVEEN